MITKLTGALFDLDGTLVDSAGDICIAANIILEKYNFPPYSIDEIKPLIGLPASVIFSNVGMNDEIEQAVSQFRDHLGQNSGGPSIVFPGVIEGLEYLKSIDIPMALATNKPSELAQKVLERSGLLKYFSFIQGSESTKAKPAPDILVKAAEAIKSPLPSTWMVGDSHVDIKASKSAGCVSIGIVYDHYLAQSMIDELPDMLIESFLDFTNLGIFDDKAK